MKDDLDSLDSLVSWLLGEESKEKDTLISYEKIKNKGDSLGVKESHIEILWYEYISGTWKKD